MLERATGGQVPVYFRADRVEDIRRVLDLSDELGFRPGVVGGEEAWRVADRLREADVPVLVSLVPGNRPPGDPLEFDFTVAGGDPHVGWGGVAAAGGRREPVAGP